MVAVVLGALEQHLQRLVAVRVALAVAGVGQAYASSTKSTPPSAESISSLAFTAVWPEELADQVGPLGLHQMVAAEQPEGVEDPAEDAGHRGLAGAGGAGEDEVPLRRLHRQALPGPQPRHVQLRGQRLAPGA